MKTLPNLWVARYAANLLLKERYVYAYLERQHDTETLYVPASRIRELIKKYNDDPRSWSDIAEEFANELGSLIAEQP